MPKDAKNASMVLDFLQNLVNTLDLTILIICHDQDLVDTYAKDYYHEIHVDEKTTRRTLHKINLKSSES